MRQRLSFLRASIKYHKEFEMILGHHWPLFRDRLTAIDPRIRDMAKLLDGIDLAAEDSERIRELLMLAWEDAKFGPGI